MAYGKLVEQIGWTLDTNQIILKRTMNAEYSVVDGEIEVEDADGGDDVLSILGPRSEEIHALVNSDAYIEGESFELLGFEQTEYTLEEVA